MLRINYVFIPREAIFDYVFIVLTQTLIAWFLFNWQRLRLNQDSISIHQMADTF